MKFLCTNRDDDLILKPLEVKLAKPKFKSERAELISYFEGKITDIKGKPQSPRYLAVRMSHLSLEDLRYLISVSEDLLNRRGKEAMQKHWYWSLRSR